MPYIQYDSDGWIRTKMSGITEQQINEGHYVFVSKKVYKKINHKLDRDSVGWRYFQGGLRESRDYYQTFRNVSNSVWDVFWKYSQVISHFWWLLILIGFLLGYLVPPFRKFLLDLISK